jgi:hypothetical protein
MVNHESDITITCHTQPQQASHAHDPPTTQDAPTASVHLRDASVIRGFSGRERDE